MIKNIKLRKNKEYAIDHITDDNFWKRKEPKYVILTINIKNNTFKYIDCLNQQLFHIRKINYLRRLMIYNIQLKKILSTIYPLRIDLIQHLLIQFIGYPKGYPFPYFNNELVNKGDFAYTSNFAHPPAYISDFAYTSDIKFNFDPYDDSRKYL